MANGKRQMAKFKKGVARKPRASVSRWVADLVENRTRVAWPPEARQLAGAWPDFPDLQELRPHSQQKGKN